MRDLPDKTLLRVDEVARFFSVSPKTIYVWCDIGALKACKPGGSSLRIFRKSVLELVKKTTKDDF